MFEWGLYPVSEVFVTDDVVCLGVIESLQPFSLQFVAVLPHVA